MKHEGDSLSSSAQVDVSHPFARIATGAGVVVDAPARSGLSPWWGLALLIAFGALGLSQTLLDLWDVWSNDPLRSIGMLIVPAAIVLTLRVWRQCGWDRRGSWWGLLPVAAGYMMSNSRGLLAWNFIAGEFKFDLLAPKLSLYFFASGAVLLFAGAEVWRKAWFPLALLLFAQPVPTLASRYLDLPLQSLSAHIARSFASSIGFSPTNPELLRLMFTPDFGMFIAPGCDGLRGAVTLGYAALIAGYLKRVSIPRWILWVCGAVLLGYVFNLLRLCALVLYYRIAVGHAALERVAKQADYAIGACLILLATLLLLRFATRKTEDGDLQTIEIPAAETGASPAPHAAWLKLAAFAFMALVFAMPGVAAIRGYRKSFAATVNDGTVPLSRLDALMPQQVGGYTLNRAWQEEANGRVAVESAAYGAPASSEAILGVWLPPSQHSMHESWRARGEDPRLRSDRSFLTAGGRPISFDSAFYSNGVTDSFAGNAFCTPDSCTLSRRVEGTHVEFALHPVDFKRPGSRAVSFFFRVEMPHAPLPEAAIQQQLAAEARSFLAGVDFSELSRRFQ